MKVYSVLLKKTSGRDEKVEIEARNENDARWAGKKLSPDIYEATVLKRIDNKKGKKK